MTHRNLPLQSLLASASILPSPHLVGKNSRGFRYKDENGLTQNCWFKDSDGWHFFNGAGIAARGWAYTTNNDIFYFDPSQEHHPALLGEVTLTEDVTTTLMRAEVL